MKYITIFIKKVEASHANKHRQKKNLINIIENQKTDYPPDSTPDSKYILRL